MVFWYLPFATRSPVVFFLMARCRRDHSECDSCVFLRIWINVLMTLPCCCWWCSAAWEVKECVFSSLAPACCCSSSCQVGFNFPLERVLRSTAAFDGGLQGDDPSSNEHVLQWRPGKGLVMWLLRWIWEPATSDAAQVFIITACVSWVDIYRYKLMVKYENQVEYFSAMKTALGLCELLTLDTGRSGAWIYIERFIYIKLHITSWKSKSKIFLSTYLKQRISSSCSITPRWMCDAP